MTCVDGPHLIVHSHNASLYSWQNEAKIMKFIKGVTGATASARTLSASKKRGSVVRSYCFLFASTRRS
jgi:hypothetical protein